MKRTGVIVGVRQDCTQEEAAHYSEQLNAHFPTVQIAIIPGAISVAFEFYDDE